MRRSIFSLALICALFSATSAHAQDPRFRVFETYVESLRAQMGIPGIAAAIVGPKNVLWEQGFGQYDLGLLSNTTRTDTPFHIDGLTQTITATMVLRCVEDGHLSLDDRIGKFSLDSPDPGATIAQLLTHTSGAANNLVFAYNPARLDPLAFALSECSGESSRQMVSDLLDRDHMINSVPGPDAVDLTPPYEGVTQASIERYTAIMQHLATPYAVDGKGHATKSHYTWTTLKASGGLISTVDDLAQFDLDLKNGIILKPETLAAAWQAPAGPQGQPLPHGMGWFVQTYNSKPIVWQFGVDENASSALLVTVPSQGLTLIMLANSDGLTKPFGLSAGDLTATPFGRVFLTIFAR